MSNLFPDMRKILKPGAVRGAHLEFFSYQEAPSLLGKTFDMINLGDRYIPSGDYVRLVTGGPWGEDGAVLQMSNTPMELRSNHDVVEKAHGNVLIAGLGLGMVPCGIAFDRAPRVTRVDVVELRADVIELVWPQILPYLQEQAPHVEWHIHCSDIHAWTPEEGIYYNTIWFDIWPNAGDLHRREMATLTRKASKWKDWSDPNVWIECWYRPELNRNNRKDRLW